MGNFLQYLTKLSACDKSSFLFQENNFSKSQWIFTKLDKCIDIVQVWFGIADGQILSIFDRFICPRHDDVREGWLGEAKVSCSFCHRGAQLILAYSWARSAVLAAGKGRG